MTPKEYIKKFREFIKDLMKGSTLLPSLVMAQALYEAADDNGVAGGSVHALTYNNDVRMRAGRSWKGPRVKLPTRQIKGDKKRARLAWFRIYLNPELSIADRVKMLTKKVAIWPTAFWHNDTVKQQARRLQALGISPDPNYGQRMFDIVNTHKLYRMDKQWWIEKIIRFSFSFVFFIGVRYALQNWDAWVPWRN